MSISAEFAALADELGVGTYRPDDTGGTIFLSRLPPDVDAGISVYRLAGEGADPKHGYDTPQIVFRVRGPRGDPDAAETTAQAVYDAFHGLRPTPPARVRPLARGSGLMSCASDQSGPTYNGPDEHDRYEWTVVFDTELRRRTPNRQ